MKPSQFDYLCPRSIDEAVAALAGADGEGKAIAGGQSLVPLMNLRLAAPALIVDLNGVPGLELIEADGGNLRVGALVRQRNLEQSVLARAVVPLLPAALRHVGHVATRNRGTVGGSIAHADPAAELPLVLATLGGSVLVFGPRGEREIAAADLFLTHFTTLLEPDEIVCEVCFPETGIGWGSAFEEVAPRHGDYAIAMVACALRVEGGSVVEARIGAGAVADVPLRLWAAEAALIGAPLDDGAAREAAALAAQAVDPTGGTHGSADYRRRLVEVLLQRALPQAFAAAIEGSR